MMEKQDFETPYSYAMDTTKFYLLSPSVTKMVCELQLWDVSQPSPKLFTWFTLTAIEFQKLRIAYSNQCLTSTITPVAPVASLPPAVVVAAPPSSNSFCSAIKINLNDYVKLKEDLQGHAFNRQLQATAASHDTMDILNPSFTPSANDAVAFKQKQRFMYKVFSQCILTSKGKFCVQAHEKDLDAQKVYKDLHAIYADQLTIQLDATSIHSELTVMKLNDKWRKSFA
jgi:hypothetical protein